ncbi:hypothetical protein A6V39_00855 [Candidatus Mycoplasma haematobovis]|uniref:Uncharacterized protein n=1 Tax=Candidatus Mycoplasma haematobovis TaxID=432608 RepID=A0A1A9QF14_9MOLU|nr:hypothetical protein [Candidatus Mycoplasma haematobovis]OAL10601.1 hypothetical protein A6V39_00855 [Candidatus Mycoplasma haematobovis]
MVNKIAIGVASTGVLAGAATGSYFYLTSGYTIEALFEKNKGNKSNLTKSSANKNLWLEKWKAYITANTPSGTITKNNSWNVSDWETNKNKNTEVPEAFAESCESKLKDKVTGTEDQKYKDFLNWCVKDN